MQDQEIETTPFDLIATFQRCSNYPREQLGVIALAQGLVRASETTGIGMDAIVERCAAASSFCPTDADLLTVAREIRDRYQQQAEASRNVVREWERDYGPAQSFDWRAVDRKRVEAAWERDRQLNAGIRKHLGLVNGKLPNGQFPDWSVMADAAEKLGYHDYAKAWRKAVQH